ncbi:hypothetical protein TNIN_496951 [Trichonephila inaurata madagascariensis]|uniref:Uncharacterized protein n=1 Tax=Trichonephila inaurata madagascariensis TaxID=2747483 RepID=A0A8X6X7C6_9ARAC|nr:hypothetical protein TNIN_496951 [Trichonephila inaurata madagascariensis]
MADTNSAVYGDRLMPAPFSASSPLSSASGARMLWCRFSKCQNVAAKGRQLKVSLLCYHVIRGTSWQTTAACNIIHPPLNTRHAANDTSITWNGER